MDRLTRPLIGPQGFSGFRAFSSLQFDLPRADSPPMYDRFLSCALVLGICVLTVSGCLPNRGTLVFVDYGAGNFWSGKGVLVEVSPDETQCRVVVRDSYLIRRNRWVHCNRVHPRRK